MNFDVIRLRTLQFCKNGPRKCHASLMDVNQIYLMRVPSKVYGILQAKTAFVQSVCSVTDLSMCSLAALIGS
jgi:hypothetical protein